MIDDSYTSKLDRINENKTVNDEINHEEEKN